MKHLNRIMKMASLCLAALLIAGCAAPQAATPEPPTPTVAAESATPVPSTPTPVPPTDTPAPTETSAPPPTPTPLTPTVTDVPNFVFDPPEMSGDSPSPRGYFSMAYDQESERAIIFGGLTGTWEKVDNYNDETWAYDPIANQWTQMAPADGPTPRESAALVYDSESDRVILFGGFPPNSVGTGLTMAYDFNTDTWTKMSNGPSSHFGAKMAYDAESDRAILFGGSTIAGKKFDETWAYDLNSDTWTEMKPSISPPGWAGFGMTYDSSADRVLIWGVGVGNVWAYDYNTNTWEERQPGEGDWPRDRNDCAMTYDALSNKTVLYGGARFGDETWVYDYPTNTWEKLELDPVPGKLWAQAVAYSPAIDRIILFGGNINSSKFTMTGDTWLFDLNTNTWTKVGLQP